MNIATQELFYLAELGPRYILNVKQYTLESTICYSINMN
jgi:hypothetical protein